MTAHADIPKSCGTAWGGGFWAAKLKMAGYDGIIVQGKASKPQYLSIHNCRPELRDATHLWGKDTHETEEYLREELGDPSASVVAIGPAGENILPGALMANDRNHVAAKAGGGTVMGSKRLKCIAISGRLGGVPVADARGLLECAIEYRKKIMANPLQQLARDGGLARQYDKVADGWTIVVKNYTDELSQKPWAMEIFDTIKQSRQIPRPCFNCPISCPYDAIIGKGPYKGYRVTLSGGLENIEGLGGIIGVMEGGTVLYLIDLLDRLGLEAGTIGQTIGVLYEAYEKGMIDEEFTEGLELKWGNADAALVLLEKFIKKEGIGKLLAEGPKGVAKAIGGEAINFMGGYKGVAMAHDYRASWELILCKAVSSGGPVIEGFGVDSWGCEPEFGYYGRVPRFDKERAPLVVHLTQKKNRWENCLGICIFSTMSVEGSLSQYTPRALSLAVGWDPFSRDDALLLGERVVNIMRLFNLRRGLTIDDDLDIGPRFLEPFKAGPFAGHPAGPHIKEMVQGYYKHMGWEPETGIPTEETLKRVGLDELIPDLRKLGNLNNITPADHAVTKEEVNTRRAKARGSK
jgi:aldehyde:ferredoxin oxidoreductase